MQSVPTSFIVLGRIPSKKNCKSALIIRGRAMIITTGKFKQWSREAAHQVRPQAAGLALPLELKKGHATFTFFAPDRRKTDLSNKWESVADLLVECGIITDDNTNVLNTVLLISGGVDKENPRAEVTLE